MKSAREKLKLPPPKQLFQLSRPRKITELTMFSIESRCIQTFLAPSPLPVMSEICESGEIFEPEKESQPPHEQDENAINAVPGKICGN